jgi:UDP-N-acetylglucosamine--N-acetylmuramyl-(pentapeptide) pyrophosphoryl-undecaprenol N-acetylglucosamine transferase
MKIVLTGGTSGGHVIPLIAVAREIKKRDISTEFMFFGPEDEYSKKFMQAEGIAMKHIMSGKMRRYFSFLNFVDAFKVPVGIIQALWHLLWFMPDAIFSKGGCATLPVVVAGWIYRIPILIHESDANPGMANSILAKFATRVAVSYPSAEIYFPSAQVVITGSPLREDINTGSREKARELFSLAGSKKTIFVVGGSQGAKVINEKILEVLPELLRSYQVIHQTGEKNFKEVEERAGELGIKNGREGYHAVPFVGEEMKDILAVCDLVISRAGSSSISEIAANAKPAIIIPIENSANDHQRMNAYSIAKIGGAVVLEESNLGEHILLGKINEIMDNEELRNKLAENIKSFYHADAAERIADGIIGMMK